MDKKKRVILFLRVLIVVTILAIVAVLTWLNFGFKECVDQACFDKSLEKCQRTVFINEGEMVFEYKIKGVQRESCVVDVELLQADLSNQDSLEVEGDKMTCYLPLGVVSIPEADIGICHGILKEGLQDLMISKLHKYIVQNIGEISANF